jgi:hypothetical protein
MIDLSGDWNSYYRYSSSGRGDDFWGQHLLQATQTGSKLRLESEAGAPSRIVMELELDAAGEAATGTWSEETDPEGYYKGKRFEGTIELKVADTGIRMNGVWHGAGTDGEMNSDVWDLAKVRESNMLAANMPKRLHATYWFPSNDSDGEEPSEYDMKAYWKGENTLILESIPNTEGSYMLIRLKIEADVATGNWYESTSPGGVYKGAQYSGAGQLMVDPETYRMDGMWAGAGYDHKLDKMRIYTGRWEIVPVSNE